MFLYNTIILNIIHMFIQVNSKQCPYLLRFYLTLSHFIQVAAPNKNTRVNKFIGAMTSRCTALGFGLYAFYHIPQLSMKMRKGSFFCTVKSAQLSMQDQNVEQRYQILAFQDQNYSVHFTLKSLDKDTKSQHFRQLKGWGIMRRQVILPPKLNYFRR